MTLQYQSALIADTFGMQTKEVGTISLSSYKAESEKPKHSRKWSNRTSINRVGFIILKRKGYADRCLFSK